MNTQLFTFPKLYLHLRQSIILLGLVILVSTCTTVRVSQDYDKEYAFGSDSTFGWNEELQRENDNLLKGDDLLGKRFRREIENVLTRAGFRQDGHPALFVSYTYVVSNKFSENRSSIPFDFGYSYSSGRRGYHRGVGIYSGGTIRQYDQGELIIKIHSAKSGQLLWKGTGTREVFVHSDPDQITRSVNEMVATVLAQFPPSG